jgi:lysozyme family protein
MKPRYLRVQASTNVPWYVIAIIHEIETGGSFTSHLHNGDPLTGRTIRFPTGRPPNGAPPFTWEESAVDALEFYGLTKVRSWTVERIAYEFENFTGFSYRNDHPYVKSPYLWNYSDVYTASTYTPDGSRMETISSPCGAMPLLRYMIGEVIITEPSIEAVMVQRSFDEMEPVLESMRRWAFGHPRGDQPFMIVRGRAFTPKGILQGGGGAIRIRSGIS